MKAKILIVLTLLAMLLLSTFACGGGEEEAGTVGLENGFKRTIELLFHS